MTTPTTPTEVRRQARDALAPCPHCGLLHTLKTTTAQDLAEDGEDAPEPWMHSDSWAVICDARRHNGPGGCGASGGFCPTEAEAVAAWNRRAAIDAMPSAPADCLYIAFSADGKAIRFWTRDQRAAEDWSADNGAEMGAYCATTAPVIPPADYGPAMMAAWDKARAGKGRDQPHQMFYVGFLSAWGAARPVMQRLPDHVLVTMYEESPTSDADMLRFAHDVEAACATAWGVRIAAANEGK